MTIKILGYLFFVVIIISSCNKNNDSENISTTIDVTKQWFFDPSGIPILTLGDGQWQMKPFSPAELALFSSLDTTNLSTTSMPTAVLETAPNFNSIYPNPFNPVYAFSLRFANSFSGQVVLKSVIVDSMLAPQFKNASRLNVSNGTCNIQIMPNISIGRYRLYYTLSSQSNPHFYKSWGNIQKKQ